MIDGVVGDYLCAKFGNLQGNPLTIHLKKNRLTEAHSENRELENDFWKYTHTDQNSDRVGEFAIGTNIDLKEVIGQILRMRNIPECISRLEIPMECTPGRSGIRRPTSMWWGGSSTSGWTTSRSCRTESFWSRRRPSSDRLSRCEQISRLPKAVKPVRNSWVPAFSSGGDCSYAS